MTGPGSGGPENPTGLLPAHPGEVREHDVLTRRAVVVQCGVRRPVVTVDEARSSGLAFRRWAAGRSYEWQVPDREGPPRPTIARRVRCTPVLASTSAREGAGAVSGAEWSLLVDHLARVLPAPADSELRRDLVVRSTHTTVGTYNTAGGAVVTSRELISAQVTTRHGQRVNVCALTAHTPAALLEALPRLMEQGHARVTGQPVTRPDDSAFTTVVADPEYAGLLAHEVVGHPLEGDVSARLSADHWCRRTVPVAGPWVTVIDSPAVSPFGRWDDECNPARDTTLIESGRVVGRLHSMESAAAAGEQPTGHGRAISWEHSPIPRMTSTGFTGGSGTLDELLDAAGPVTVLLYGARGGRALADGRYWAASQGGLLVRQGRVIGDVGPVLMTGHSDVLLSAIRGVSAGGRVFAGGEGGCGKAGQFPLDAATHGGGLLLSPAPELRPLWR